MQARVLCVLLCLAVMEARAARILVVLPTNTKSHHAMYGRIIHELAKRNHHLTVITHFPMTNPPANVDQISLAGTIPEIVNDLSSQRDFLKPAFVRNLETIIKECVFACDVVAQTTAVKALIGSSKTFDLIIVEVFGSECFLPLSRRFQAPLVGLLSSVPLPWVNEQLGIPEGTAYIPSYMMGYGQHMNIWERFTNTVAVIWGKILYKYKSQMPSQGIADRLFGVGPKLNTLAQNYSLVLSNSHFSINEVRPLVPAMVEVGGLHLDNEQKLPVKLERLLDESREGFIYWSFGSMSKIETMPRRKLSLIFSALSKLPHTVLVKMNRDNIPGNITIPENVFTMEWIPQFKTLCHPNIKLFISHGGLLGIQEAVACGVPMLTIPLYADQALNGRAMEDRGVARTLSFDDSTAEAWEDTLRDLLTVQRYKENAYKLREIFLDRPTPPLETAVYWIEYVLRHKGATHLRSPALDLSLIQYLLIDVTLIGISITAMTIYILHKLFRYLCTRCIKCWSNEKVVLEKRLFTRNISLFHCFLWIYKIKTN